MKKLGLLFLLSTLVSCNALKAITDGETDLDDKFGAGQYNEELWNGLVSFWRFDESGSTQDRSDIQGSNNLIYNQGSINSTGGINGNALDCSSIDGTNRFTLNSSIGLNYGNNGNFSISFWIYLNTFNAGDYIADFSTGYNITLSGSSDITLNVNGNTVSGNVNTGAWTHVTYTVDRVNGSSTYINGAQQNFTTHNSTGVSYIDSTFAVCSSTGFAANPDGQIDSFGIWNRTLSSSEISDLYRGFNNLD